MPENKYQQFVEELAKSALEAMSYAQTPKEIGFIVGQLAATAFNSGLIAAENYHQQEIKRMYYGGAYDAASKLSRLNLN